MTLAVRTYGPPVKKVGWTLEAAAEPLEGVCVNLALLDRPGHTAALKLLPEFTARTGIEVTWETMPYDRSHSLVLRDLQESTASFHVVLIDAVWIGELAQSGWLDPLGEYYTNPDLADPGLRLSGFFPILLNSLGSWDKVIYGLPFDNYAGLMFYNRRLLAEAGLGAPPATWRELLERHVLAFAGSGRHAFALQSRRGETQSADSFMRMIWQAGGELLDPATFEPRLSSRPSLEGLQFRQRLLAHMPAGIVDWDHEQAVTALAGGRVAVITEWSPNYAILADPATSTIAADLGVAIEPAGADGRPHPALGGFSLGINAAAPLQQRQAAWLLIQWLTSEAKAEDYIRSGGVSGRQSAYRDAELRRSYPYFGPLVESWAAHSNPYYRPRFPEWPRVSEIVSEIGCQMMLGRTLIERGVRDIEDRMREILADYIDGRRARRQ